MTNKKIQPAIIGVFVILSVALFMTAIVIFGGASFFDKENLVITYFEGSLQGLSVGAPVTYRGVTIGQVKEIKIHIRADEKKSEQLIIPVVIALSAGDTLVINGADNRNDEEINIFLKSLCAQGLRAKLKTQSLVTGKRYIDLAFYKNSTPVYQDTIGEYFEIPTLPSEMYQLTKMMENVNLDELYHKVLNTFDSIEQLTGGLAQSLSEEKTQQLMNDLTTATATLNSIFHQVDSDLPSILTKVDTGLDQINVLSSDADQLVTSLDKQLAPVIQNMNATLVTIDTVLKQADTLISQANKSIQPNSPLYYRITEAMAQLEQTARSIETLSEFIYRNPDTLIFGLQQTGDSHHE